MSRFILILLFVAMNFGVREAAHKKTIVVNKIEYEFYEHEIVFFKTISSDLAESLESIFASTPTHLEYSLPEYSWDLPKLTKFYASSMDPIDFDLRHGDLKAENVLFTIHDDNHPEETWFGMVEIKNKIEMTRPWPSEIVMVSEEYWLKDRNVVEVLHPPLGLKFVTIYSFRHLSQAKTIVDRLYIESPGKR